MPITGVFVQLCRAMPPGLLWSAMQLSACHALPSLACHAMERIPKLRQAQVNKVTEIIRDLWYCTHFYCKEYNDKERT
jgi:hypothetical protein